MSADHQNTEPDSTTDSSIRESEKPPKLKTDSIQSGALAGRSLTAAVILLAAPILLQQFAHAFVGLVDNTLTGHLPDGIAVAALDGVSISSYMNWFIGVCMAAVGVGGAALIARAIGGGDRPLAEQAIGQTILFGVLWGFVIGVLIWLITPPLTELAELSDEAAKYCLQYTTILALGMPLSACLMIATTCLHGAGETIRPTIIMLVVNVVNVIVSWALSGVDLTVGGVLITNPFAFDMHVIGIALGSAVAHGVGCILILALMFRGVKGVRLYLHAMKPDLEVLRRIVRIGVPSFLDGLGMWAGQLIAIFWILGEITKRSGTETGLLGSHMIAVRWESFSFMPGFAMGVAAGTLAGQFLGAGNAKMASKSIIVCTAIGMVLMGTAGVIFMVAGKWLTQIISSEAIHLEIAPKLLFACGIVQIGFAMAMVIRGGLRGVGDTKASMIITWFSTYAIRIPLCWVIGIVLDGGIVGVWIALSIELMCRGLFFLGRFLQGNWKHQTV